MTQVLGAATRLGALRPVERIAHLVGALLMLSGVVHFGVFLVDGGPWEGPVSWRKPTTFGLSFGLTLITVAWVTSYLVMSPRLRTWLLGIFTADCVLEVTGITVQAWRRVPSHFNTETPASQAIAMSLAVGGAVLVATLVTFAVIALRGRIRGPSDLRLALRAGWALLLLTLATGVAMIARGTVLYRTQSPAVAYETAGFLKPVHGVALHAILVLPLLAVLLRAAGQAEPRRYQTVRLATWLYVLATALAAAMSLT
ncbi:hypothetical protein GCM10010168_80900 [Actinoplanes ianthinogenes]|uniref:DUF420 domain-containing protein n=1 Tax=Actinoplanes ianthinogenes TaxID=122358 RepID=A0ABM7LMV1_9ACTN|nr:hypothetical protein [Actinoplanes ianthinogenes]BCJ40576.1 hypothetical protein Aiant_12330 [Actinoplanes ianthinogenes]GGR49957.1 hypothetical protein GCM10010168_80900 [Actinoplanes ianthinogenes]